MIPICFAPDRRVLPECHSIGIVRHWFLHRIYLTNKKFELNLRYFIKIVISILNLTQFFNTSLLS